MSKLCEIVAVVQGLKARTQKRVTELHHLCQRDGVFAGLARTYTPSDDDGERQPPESKRVQADAIAILQQAAEAWKELFRAVATQDQTNCEAKADVKIDGTTILEQVPVTHLLFLEKQLADIRTFLAKLPVLDPAFEWHRDEQRDCWATPPIETTRTQKQPKVVVKYDATEQHPAQTELFTEDVRVGTWATTHLSGNLPADHGRAMLRRVDQLIDATKAAREQANSTSVVTADHGDNLFDYILNGH